MDDVFEIGLSSKDFIEASKRVYKYQYRLERKMNLFVEELCKIGIPVVNSNVQAAQGDANRNVTTKVVVNYTNHSATLTVSGADLLFIEFGAGVYYNKHPHSSPHPLNQSNSGNSDFSDYTIGDYIDHNGQQKHKGLQDEWEYGFSVSDSKGQQFSALATTHGVEATFPVYKASLEMRRRVLDVARQVFSN